MLDVVHRLAEIEQRPLEAVLADLQWPDADTLRVDASPELGAAGAATSGKLSFSLHNPGRTSLFLLRWQTPLEGLSDDLFDVRINGESVRYIGRDVKRAAPTAEDYLEIGPGETLP